MPALAGAAGAPDAVHVIFGNARQIVIYDQFNIRHINAARGNIGGNKHAVLPRLESIKRFAALVQGAIGMNFRGGMPQRADMRGDPFCAELHSREDEHGPPIFLKYLFQKLALCFL